MRMAHHQHLASVVDTYEDNRSYFIVINPLAKCDLQGYLNRKLDPPKNRKSWISFGKKRLQLFRWIYCLIVTLEHLHASNICHRDIKPSNILVGRHSPSLSAEREGSDDGIYFTDFGTSFAHDGETIKTSTHTLGTRKYEPPEAFVEGDSNEERRNRIGRKGDVFSLGCVFLDILGAICRSLGFTFPETPAYYADIAGDDDFLDKIRKVPELKPRFKKIPEDIQYLGLTNELLEFVASKMTVPEECRSTAADAKKGLQEIMDRRSFAFPVCCAHFALSSSLHEEQATTRLGAADA